MRDANIKAAARIWFDPSEDRYWIEFDYCDAFIAFLKTSIPRRARTYDPQSRAWSFGRAYLARVEAEAALHFPELHVEREPPRKRKPRVKKTEVYSRQDFLIVEFFHALPREALASAYKKAATLFHPDHQGGSHDAMQYLNGLWDEIQKLYKS